MTLQYYVLDKTAVSPQYLGNKRHIEGQTEEAREKSIWGGWHV